ncbi:hypothetical protein [Pinirhizobacter soli]|uniref:hypothetical protein n=1 Tax=Pinirhizobacter soli TaxID=2786953 RepID=UPI00202A7628|nr:hypothetical protein [Pinirhizobacter soli]
MPHGWVNWRIAFMAMIVLSASCGAATAKPAFTVVVTVVNRDTDKPMANAELSLYKYRCFFVCHRNFLLKSTTDEYGVGSFVLDNKASYRISVTSCPRKIVPPWTEISEFEFDHLQGGIGQKSVTIKFSPTFCLPKDG